MKKVLTGILASLAVFMAVPAQAQHCDTRRGVDHFCGVQHPGSYREVQWQRNHGYYHGHRHGGLNSTEKVIIGAVIGGIVVDAIHRNRAEPAVVYAPPLPPQSYPAPNQTCTTREIFDRFGQRVSVERVCY